MDAVCPTCGRHRTERWWTWRRYLFVLVGGVLLVLGFGAQGVAATMAHHDLQDWRLIWTTGGWVGLVVGGILGLAALAPARRIPQNP